MDSKSRTFILLQPSARLARSVKVRGWQNLTSRWCRRWQEEERTEMS